MNLLSQPQFDAYGKSAVPSHVQAKNSISHFDLVGAVRRQMWILLVSTAVGAGLGGGYILQAVPTFTSSASILIDAKNVGLAAANAFEGSLAFEAGAVDSQLQILQSDRIAKSVARQLGLQNNMLFLNPEQSALESVAGGLIGALSNAVSLLSGSSQPVQIATLPEEMRLILAGSKLQRSLRVGRVGRTYVFVLEYSDQDPRLAQAVAGQYVSAYLEDQLDSKFESTRRATNWMEERLRELRTRSLTADQAVQKYRADNNLIAASGRLIDDQVLTDATTQLTAARSQLDTASARYQRLREIVEKQDVSGSLTELIQNPNVAQLRSRYLDASKMDSDMSVRYGVNHSVAEKARRDMAEYKRLMFEELKNLLPGYQSDVQIAQSRVNSIQTTINSLRQTTVSNDSAMVKLRALEQESESLKTLYSTFLQKYQEMQQQQSFPVTDARIISDASVPLFPTSPRSLLSILAFLLAGGVFGAGVAALREWRDRGIRTPAQVREELGLDFVANIPTLETSSAHNRRRPLSRGAVVKGIPLPDGRLRTNSENETLQKVLTDPLSQFAEAIRAVKFKVSDGHRSGSKGIVIGMISMFPDEGKSTIAKNLASSLAFQGTRTVLVDGDVRNPSLTASLVGSTNRGLVDIIERSVTLENALAIEAESGLAFLPGASRARQAGDIFTNSRTHDVIEELRRRFEVVIIDFPPVGALMDALAASSVVDGYLFIVQWGKTPRKTMQEFIVNNPGFADKILGVVLNRVDMKRLERYGSGLAAAHYGKYGGKYFNAD